MFPTTRRLFLIGLSLLVFACGSSSEPVAFSTPTQTFTLEGSPDIPLFAGPNPAQVAYTPNLAEAANGGTVADARLLQATFRMPDGQTFGDAHIQGIVLQLVADEADMVQVGVVNPVAADQSEVSLTLSEEAEIGEIFKQSSMYLVADFDLTEDVDTTLVIEGDFGFELSVEK